MASLGLCLFCNCRSLKHEKVDHRAGYSWINTNRSLFGTLKVSNVSHVLTLSPQSLWYFVPLLNIGVFGFVPLYGAQDINNMWTSSTIFSVQWEVFATSQKLFIMKCVNIWEIHLVLNYICKCILLSLEQLFTSLQMMMVPNLCGITRLSLVVLASSLLVALILYGSSHWKEEASEGTYNCTTENETSICVLTKVCLHRPSRYVI